jgi:pseudouridine-5'-phosphate glycosidase
MKSLRVPTHIAEAVAAGRPVVALESTVIAHGLPAPLNLETARACERAVVSNGATPATVGVVDGAPTVGLSEDELTTFASGRDPRGGAIAKVNLSNLAAVMLDGAWGATTVAATMQLASLAGVRVFSTGGIGGVHRGAADSYDVSADLTALARVPLVCVSAGAKAILDLPKTVERLETLGVPVVGYSAEEFPAFYCRASGLPVDVVARSPEQAARAAALHWQSGGRTAVLVCVPVPEEFEIPVEDVERAIGQALEEARRAGVRGKAITPFLLSRMERLTSGGTLKANRALLVNNAEVAAKIARCLTGFEL